MKILNLDNIRTKLLFYYSIVVTAVLTLFSVILLDQFYIQNLKTVDKQLITVINEIDYNRQFYKKFDHDEFKIKNLYITTYKHENNKFKKLTTNNPDSVLENLKTIAIDEFHRFSTNDRIRVIRFHSNKIKNIYIEAATTLDDKIEPAMDHLKNLLLIWIPTLMILSIILGYYIIKSSLRPVKKAVREVKDIESHNLNKRISSVTHNDEIEELITTFNFMLDKLDESFSKVKRFSNDVSHELKTPLTIIRGEIELGLRKERSNEEYKQILKSTLEETKSLQELINNLLFLSKVNNKELQEQFESVEIDDLLTEIISQNKQLIESKNINFDFKSFDNTVVQGHPFLLKILIGNIIQNSIKYSHKNSTIEIYLDKDKLTVKDHGIGIKEEDIKNIFDRFYRVENSRNGEGYGLGLSIVRSIAQIHKFPVYVKSNYGEYTLFTVNFTGNENEEQ